MFRLLIVLCAAIFGVMLVAGEDRGQMRMGLANAAAPTPQIMTAEAQIAPEPETMLVEAAYTPTVATPNIPVILPLVKAEAVVQPAVAVTTTATAPVEGLFHTINVSAVNVRGGPSTGFPVVGRLTMGEAVKVISETGSWAHILVEGDGVEGFVASRFLATAAD